MSKFEIKYQVGATPIDPNERNQLIPTYISNQTELNILERENILQATNWIYRNKKIKEFNISICLKLHKKMFSEVWMWAGKIRLSDKNIGVPKEQIVPKMKALFDDVEYWIKNKTFDLDEAATRFHHRLVSIHPFPNGNGRHARLMTDLLNQQNNNIPFSWGQMLLTNEDMIRANSKINKNELNALQENKVRMEYINSLRLADKGNILDLIKFVRS